MEQWVAHGAGPSPAPVLPTGAAPLKPVGQSRTLTVEILKFYLGKPMVASVPNSQPIPPHPSHWLCWSWSPHCSLGIWMPALSTRQQEHILLLLHGVRNRKGLPAEGLPGDWRDPETLGRSRCKVGQQYPNV